MKYLIGLLIFIPWLASAEVPADTFFFMDNKGYDLAGQQKYFCLMDNNCYTISGEFAFNRKSKVEVITPVSLIATTTEVSLVLNKSYIDSLDNILKSPIRVLSKGAEVDIKSFNYTLYNLDEAAYVKIQVGDNNEYLYDGPMTKGASLYGDYILLNPIHTSVKESLPLLTTIQSTLIKYSLQIISITYRVEGENKDRIISFVH